jgi:hypothetical protein
METSGNSAISQRHATGREVIRRVRGGRFCLYSKAAQIVTRWTAIQDQMLLDFGSTTANHDLATMTGRPLAGVVYRLKYWGIRKQARAKSRIYSEARSRQWARVRQGVAL